MFLSRAKIELDENLLQAALLFPTARVKTIWVYSSDFLMPSYALLLPPTHDVCIDFFSPSV